MKGDGPKARAKGKHWWNSCGSEARRDERKQTESRVRRAGKENMRNQVGKNGENQRSESGRVHRRRPTVRGKREERGKEETEAE